MSGTGVSSSGPETNNNSQQHKLSPSGTSENPVDIFYKSNNNRLKKKGKVFPIRSEMTILRRVGPGKPACWQSIKNDHRYFGNAEDVWLELLLSEDGEKYNYPLSFFWDRFMTKTYKIAMDE